MGHVPAVKPPKEDERERKLRQKKKKYLLDPKVDEVATLIVKGWSQKKIRDHLFEKYNISRPNGANYIRKALQALDVVLYEKEDKLFAIQVNRMEGLLETAMNNNDVANAIKVINEMNKVYGLHKEKKDINLKAPTIKFEFGNTNNVDENDVDNE